MGGRSKVINWDEFTQHHTMEKKINERSPEGARIGSGGRGGSEKKPCNGKPAFKVVAAAVLSPLGPRLRGRGG